ncbi:MAG: hypothetical protein JSV44_04000, partial [Candidatus Zixiibacteriota bacterium]
MKSYVTEKSLQGKTKKWLAEIAPYNFRNLRPKKGRTALLVIDMQRFFLDPDSPTFTCGGWA